MKKILNAVRGQALQANNDRAANRIGIVQSYDKSTHCVKALIKPDDVETGWIPVASISVGNGWGIFSPPSPGEMIIIGFQEGSIDDGFVQGRLWSDSARPVDDNAGCPSGEFWIVHQSGSKLKFENDGTVTIIAHTSINSSAEAWNHSGPVNIDGKLSTTGDIVSDGDVLAGGSSGISLTHHKHGDTQPGSGETGESVV